MPQRGGGCRRVWWRGGVRVERHGRQGSEHAVRGGGAALPPARRGVGASGRGRGRRRDCRPRRNFGRLHRNASDVLRRVRPAPPIKAGGALHGTGEPSAARQLDVGGVIWGVGRRGPCGRVKGGRGNAQAGRPRTESHRDPHLHLLGLLPATTHHRKKAAPPA